LTDAGRLPELGARRRSSGRGGVQGPGRSAPGILVGVATQLRCCGDVEPALDVEAEQQNVAVLHQVVPPLAPHQSLFPRSLVRPHAREIGERHGLGADEAALEIRMDFARRVERRAAAVHGPGAHLVFAHGEERLQAEQPVARVNQGSRPGSLTPALARYSARSFPDSSPSSASNLAEKRTISASSWCACTAARSSSSHCPPPAARSSSFTFAAYRIGFAVISRSCRSNFTASSLSPPSRAPR